MTTDIEDVIFENLLYNENYARSVTPYLKTEYFTEKRFKVIFDSYSKFLENYNSVPSTKALSIEVEKDTSLTQEEHLEVVETIESLSTSVKDDAVDMKWLVDETESFCQDRSIYLAVRRSIKILNHEDKDLDKGALPDLLSDALSVSFDSSIGHDYFLNADERFDFYHKKENRLPFGIEMLDKVTKGGPPSKTLTIFMGGTGSGKSLVMCHLAANYLMSAKNVLYLTLELAEERVAERIDANLLNITMDDLRGVNKETYTKMLGKVKDKTTGNLVIKEYPTASAHVGHFRHLLRELKMKQKFVPDVIIVDYLNICSSSRLKAGGNVNSYTLVKSIAEELRGLATETNVPIISATQSNREGYGSSDLSLTNTSESFGLPSTADIFFGLIVTEELQRDGKIMVKQLKNRFSDISQNSTFMVGVDRSKMKLFDLDSSNMNERDVASAVAPSKPFFVEDDNKLFNGGSKVNKFSDFDI